MMRVELRSPVECPRLQGGRLEGGVHIVPVRGGDDGHPEGRCDRHGVAAGVAGCASDGLEPLGVILWPVGESGEPCVAVTPCGPQHARAVGGDPNLGPFAFVRREIEHRVSKREERRITIDQFAFGVPQRADGGKGLLEPRHRFRPVDAVGLVAHAFARADAKDRAATRHQVQRRSSLGGDGGVAFTGVGDADTETDSVEATARGKATQQSPGVHGRVRRPDMRAAAVYFGSHSGRGV